MVNVGGKVYFQEVWWLFDTLYREVTEENIIPRTEGGIHLILRIKDRIKVLWKIWQVSGYVRRSHRKSFNIESGESEDVRR